MIKFIKGILERYVEKQVLYIKKYERDVDARYWKQKMYALGLDAEKYLGHPYLDPGTAILWMEDYKIVLHKGTHFGQLRANLDKKEWANSIHPRVKSGEFGSFFADEPHNKIDSIYAFGETLGEAVVKCLCNARIAGVV